MFKTNQPKETMTKQKKLIQIKYPPFDKTVKTYADIFKMENMYQRDHKEAFENAKSKGLNDPQNYMYMYSKDNKDYFKNINFRNYINFDQS